MTKPDDPINISFKPLGENANTGLTKREYFAARAMQGLLTNNKIEAWSELVIPKGYSITMEGAALAKADELIKQLNQGKQND